MSIQCDVIIEKRRRVTAVCGRQHEEGSTHYNGLRPHGSNSLHNAHVSHKMVTNDVGQMYCKSCLIGSSFAKDECPA